MEWVPPWLDDVGIGTAVVFLVALGWLVPRRFLTKSERDAEHWRKALELSEKARIEEAAQTRSLTEQVREMVRTLDLHTRLLEALREALRDSSRRRGSREDTE